MSTEKSPTAQVHSELPLGRLVAGVPAAAKVLYRHKLDYCCGGGQSLSEACASIGLDPRSVMKEIEDEVAVRQGTDVRWDERPLDELITHILTRYHAPLDPELRRLVDLARKVERVHAAKPECPAGLAALLTEVSGEIASHLEKEEQILFPLILSGRGSMALMPVKVMLKEHEDHGANLRRIRELTSDLRLPEGACNTWRELYRALGELEMDLMDHIHLENSVLFPRALAS